MTSPLVSVILVNHNCGHLLDLVFPTLTAQEYQPLEVIVVDNGSTDESIAAIRATYPHVRIIELDRNAGFSRALNTGIRESSGEYLLSLNFDVVLDPGFIAALVDMLERRPDVGWAAGAMRRLSPTGPVDSIDCNGHYLLPSRYCYGYDPAHPEPAFYDTPREVFGASACAAMYRRRLLDAVALDGEVFDEALFAYFEDVDLDWRAQQLGFKCVFVPTARGAHMRGGTGLFRRPEVAALLLANRFLVMIKNDDLAEVLQDLSPIVRRTVLDVGMHLRRHPSSVPMAVARVMRLAPSMIRKRRRIRRARIPDARPIAMFRLPTKFLG